MCIEPNEKKKKNVEILQVDIRVFIHRGMRVYLVHKEYETFWWIRLIPRLDAASVISYFESLTEFSSCVNASNKLVRGFLFTISTLNFYVQGVPWFEACKPTPQRWPEDMIETFLFALCYVFLNFNPHNVEGDICTATRWWNSFDCGIRCSSDGLINSGKYRKD